MAVLHPHQRKAGLIFALACLNLMAFSGSSAAASSSSRHLVVVPAADKFTPFVLTVHVGDLVEWVNNDTDDHTIVTNNALTTAGRQGLDHLILGTDNNGGQPGAFVLTFNHSGTYAYYCRFHATLDADHQPIAPGPHGGIQDANGNFGTPMNGVITVLP